MGRPIEIGVSAGVRIILREDGSAGWLGATSEEALASAKLRLKFADKPQRDLDYIAEWIVRMETQIAADDLETAARKAAGGRLLAGPWRRPAKRVWVRGVPMDPSALPSCVGGRRASQRPTAN